jgi:hypothetical protein
VIGKDTRLSGYMIEQALTAGFLSVGIDVLLLQEELPRGQGTERKESNLKAVEAIATRAHKPIAFVTMISHGLTDYSRALRGGLPHLAFLQEIDKSVSAVRSVMDYVTRKYGRENVAQIITFGTMAARGVLRDAGRGMDMPYAEVDRIAKMVPTELHITLDNKSTVNYYDPSKHTEDDHATEVARAFATADAQAAARKAAR